MVNLSQKQLGFLKTEFGLTSEKIAVMSPDEWDDVLEKCCDIAFDEAISSYEEKAQDVTERCNIAEDICEISYDELHAERREEVAA